MRTIPAYLRGVLDGYRQWNDLCWGMTYPDEDRNLAYDRGANLGQWIGRAIFAEPTL